MATANIKSVKLRIKSIQNTIQITKTMELVTSSKLRRAREKVEASAPYFSTLRQTLINVVTENADYTSIYTRKSQSHRHCYMLIAGSRGMAGDYNTNLFHAFETESRGKESAVLPFGGEARDYVIRKRPGCLENEKMTVVSIRVSDCYVVARRLCTLFHTEEFGHTPPFYTSFVSLVKQEPGPSSLLPLVDLKNEDYVIYGKEEEGKKRAQSLILYEPSAGEVYDTTVSKYLAGLFYNAAASSLTSGYAAHRTAMEAMTDNAGEMVDKLSLYYNHTHQASVTQRITEIVSGAEGSNG